MESSGIKPQKIKLIYFHSFRPNNVSSFTVNIKFCKHEKPVITDIFHYPLSYHLQHKTLYIITILGKFNVLYSSMAATFGLNE